MAPKSPTDAAQGSMQLASYNDEKAQEFRIWLGEKARSGVIFGANGVRECSFIPKEDIEKYFDIGSDRNLWKVDALLKEACRNYPHNVHPDDVARDCPRVFSILIRIGYQQFIPEFVRKDQLHDHALPFTPDKETLFPKLEGGRTFFKTFEEEQWQFCVEKLSYGLEVIIFDDRTILPVKEIKELEKGEGVSGIVHKITIQEDYDDLKSSRDKPRSLGPVIMPEHLHTYVVKTYHQSDGGRYFEAEARAFRFLNEADKLVPNIVGFHRAFKQNDSLNIILQYANVGTLEDYFKKVTSPQLRHEILGVWRRLAGLNMAVAGIHKQQPRDTGYHSQVAIFQGWHQDIKPANVLVRGDIENDPYNVEFLLADLGLAHFAAFVNGEAGSTGEDFTGARTYGAPEHNINPTRISHSRIELKQKSDIWALACVYSEFNTWVVRGFSGVKAFRSAREREVNDSRLGPVFHDKLYTGVLNTVRSHHEDLARRRVMEDFITPHIWSGILQWLFTGWEVRQTADQLKWSMDSMLEQAEKQLEENHFPRAQRTLTTPAWINTEQIRPPSSPHTPEQLPPEFENSNAHGSYPWTPPSVDAPKRLDVSTTRYSGGLAQSPDSLLSEKRSSAPRTLNRNSDSSASQPVGFGFLRPEGIAPDMFSQSSRLATDLQRPSSELAFRYPSPSMTSEVSTERNPPVTATEQYGSHSHQQSSGGSERSKARGPLKGKGRVHGIPISKQPPPVLTVQQLASWAQLTHTSKWKLGPLNLGGSSDFPLSGPSYSSEEIDLLKKMKERDHIFVLDDSVSMKEHWEKVKDLYGNLILMIKKKDLDPNGSQLQFIDSDYIDEQKDTTGLKKAVEKHGHKIAGTTDFARRLEKILNKYFRDLRMNPSKSPISLYVLTNGVWEISRATKSDKDHHLEHISNVISRAVNMLEKMGASEKQIGIQFIRFGKDKIGRTRLKYLDEKIKKRRGLARDICDTTPADGNVWKMMLGSIDTAWDDDAEDDADDTDDTEDNAGDSDDNID